MTSAAVLGLMAGLGAVGVAAGLRSRPVPLDVLATIMGRPATPDGTATAPGFRRLGRSAGEWAEAQPFASGPAWASLRRALAAADTPLDQLVTRCLVAGGAGLLGPLVGWLGLAALGIDLQMDVLAMLSAVGAATAALVPVCVLLRNARHRRRHFRAVVGSFLDLVVLELAGGTGIEGALFAASQVSPDWAARRMARALLTARDSGVPPWSALAALGDEVGLAELTELANTLELAGSEGARVRESLKARAESLRRHEQADEESAANAVTERLFVPGALLLVGFLCFVGYPAFTRIVGGL